MSKLQVDILESKSGIGLTCTPDDLFYQRAFAWCAFSGGASLRIDGSFNISAVTDESDGRYLCTFDNNAINNKYIVLGSSGVGNNDSNADIMLSVHLNQRPSGASGCTTSSFSVNNMSYTDGGTQASAARDYVCVVVFGGF